MSRSTYTAFQRHLLHFSTPPPNPRLTLTSALRAGLSLGLNFPLALFLSISLRILYAPFPNYFSGIPISRIPANQHRTQLEGRKLDRGTYSCGDLLALLGPYQHGLSISALARHAIDQGHVVAFWSMAASTKTHRVSREDVERFQQGKWEEAVVERRKGREDVLPFWRGGPLGVGAHSWAVGKLVGVRVYDGGKTE